MLTPNSFKTADSHEKGPYHLLYMRRTLGCHSDQTLVCKLFFSCIKGGRDLFPWEPAVIRLFGASKLSKSVGLCCLHTQVWSPWHHKRSIHSTMAFQASHKIGKLGLNFGYSHQRFLKARLVAGLHFNFFCLKPRKYDHPFAFSFDTSHRGTEMIISNRSRFLLKLSRCSFTKIHSFITGEARRDRKKPESWISMKEKDEEEASW